MFLTLLKDKNISFVMITNGYNLISK